MRANSSGELAPSRKLNADRACSSTYISRKFPARTSFRAVRRSRSGKDRSRDALPPLHCGRLRATGNEFPDPIHPVARDLPATSHRTCATDRKRLAPVRATPEKQRGPDALHAARVSRERAGERFESSLRIGRFFVPLLEGRHSRVCGPLLRLPGGQETAASETLPGDSFRSATGIRYFPRPPHSQCARW